MASSPSELSRHTAVITGASSGIGEGVARCFARNGAKLVLAARRADRLEALADELRNRGASVLVCPTDVTDERQVVHLFQQAEAFSPITLLVANAGMVHHRPTTDVTLVQWREVIDVNVTGAFLCAREAMRAMIPRRRGRIITIGSLSAQMPRADTIAYATSKFALEGMTRSLALDGRAHGITASIVHPGQTVSDLIGEAGRGIASDRIMETRYVAELVAMMASVPDEMNLLTATMLPIAQPYLGRG